MDAVAPLHRANAPSYFTFGSHAAMFAGFTPGVASAKQSFLNPKFGKLFRLENAGSHGKRPSSFVLSGPNIITGFRRMGYLAIGAGAVQWFNPETETGQILSSPFQRFFYSGNTYSLAKQLKWLMASIVHSADKPVFVFLNVGETHVPYYFEGAKWSHADNPCVPFQLIDRASDCRMRQTACLEYADGRLAPLLSAFSAATILICADHGDCWGEDGLWEHGISHEMTLTVPLLVRVAGKAVGLAQE